MSEAAYSPHLRDPAQNVKDIGGAEYGQDTRTDEQKKTDKELAERLCRIIEDANSRVVPLTKMIRKVRVSDDYLEALFAHTRLVLQHIENMEAQKPEDRDENELIKQIKPLLEQAEKILNETLGAVKGADPDSRLSNKAKRNVQSHTATPEEQRLAEALKVVRMALLSISPTPCADELYHFS